MSRTFSSSQDLKIASGSKSGTTYTRTGTTSTQKPQSLNRPSEVQIAAQRYSDCRRALHATGRLAFPQGTGSTRAHVECRNAFNALKALSPPTAEKLSLVQFPSKVAQVSTTKSSSLPKGGNTRPDIQPRPAEVPPAPAAGKPSASAAPPGGAKGADTETPDYMQEEVVTTDPIVLIEDMKPAQQGVMSFIKKHKLAVAGGVVVLGLGLWFITRR